MQKPAARIDMDKIPPMPPEGSYVFVSSGGQGHWVPVQLFGAIDAGIEPPQDGEWALMLVAVRQKEAAGDAEESA